MKILIVLLIILSTQANAIERDKVKHFAVSAAIGTASQYYFNDWRYSSVACLSVGFAKELTDAYIDHKDLLANALGCATGIFIYNATDYIINIRPIDHGAQVNLQFKF